MTSMGPMLRVVKLGGSLFEFDELVPRLRAFLNESAAETLVVVGGGPWAEAVRDVDRRFALGEEASHVFAMQAMRLSARVLSRLLPELKWADGVGDWQTRRQQVADPSTAWIVDPMTFLMRDDARQRTPLPPSWDVTSDSIAARLATIVQADELVLLKSGDPPEPFSIESAVAAGYVDPYFLHAASKIPSIRCVNLRATSAKRTSKPTPRAKAKR